MARISRDQMLMEIAHVVSHRGTCPRAQVGAILSHDSRIISSGYVGSRPGEDHCDVAGCIIGTHGGCIRTIHAEDNAIRYSRGVSRGSVGSTLYTTLAPCGDCAQLIVEAGIARVVYHHTYRDPRGLNTLKDAGLIVHQFPQDVSTVDYGN